MSFVEFIKWLAAGGAAIGVVSSIVMQLIKKLRPTIEGDLALYLSILVAVLLAALAQASEPYLGKIPPVLLQYWWVAGVLWEQIIYKWLTNANVSLWRNDKKPIS